MDQPYVRDEDRNIARIDLALMEEIGLSRAFDVIEIIAGEGKESSSTSARCLRLYPIDQMKGIIKLDPLTRRNAGNLAYGEQVIIRKAKSFEVEQVVVSPVERDSPPVDVRYLTDALETWVIKISDVVGVPYMSGRILFRVLGLNPSTEGEYSGHAGNITRHTAFVVRDLTFSESS